VLDVVVFEPMLEPVGPLVLVLEPMPEPVGPLLTLPLVRPLPSPVPVLRPEE
jgi:hypothetical protein